MLLNLLWNSCSTAKFSTRNWKKLSEGPNWRVLILCFRPPSVTVFSTLAVATKDIRAWSKETFGMKLCINPCRCGQQQPEGSNEWNTQPTWAGKKGKHDKAKLAHFNHQSWVKKHCCHAQFSSSSRPQGKQGWGREPCCLQPQLLLFSGTARYKTLVQQNWIYKVQNAKWELLYSKIRFLQRAQILSVFYLDRSKISPWTLLLFIVSIHK